MKHVYIQQTSKCPNNNLRNLALRIESSRKNLKYVAHVRQTENNNSEAVCVVHLEERLANNGIHSAGDNVNKH